MAKHRRKRKPVSYLYKRKDSAKWWVKLQPLTGPRIEKSLGTSDRALAEMRALPMINDHKAQLLAARSRLEQSWVHEYEPDREHTALDGHRVLATDRELFHLDGEGKITHRSPNGAISWQIAGLDRRLGLTVPVHIEVDETKVRPKLATKNGDDAIFKTYLEHSGLSGRIEHEARGVWALYKTLTDSKLLKDADRDDGRKLASHYADKGLKSATIRKKIGWLTAAVNFAIKENKLKFNPFVSVVPRRDDKTIRLPLNDADMKAIRGGVGRLGERDRVLFRLLACTGMRLSEAFEIDGELTERGVRYVMVGHKTEQSRRRVPLPAGVLPCLPRTIKRPLFRGGAPAASKRLNRFLRDVGVGDARKVVHSLRHRAQDRLRAARCPEDVRWALLGHEEKTVAAGYGEGFPVPLLKQWIDKIGV